MLKNAIQHSKLLIIIPIVSLLIGATFLFFQGAYQLLSSIYSFFIAPHENYGPVLAANFISVMDTFLLAVVLYIFAVGLYELFIGPLDLPDWLKIEGIDQLKAKLASVIVLILAVTFTKKLVQWKDPMDTFWFAMAISAIMGVLIFYYKAKEPH